MQQEGSQMQVALTHSCKYRQVENRSDNCTVMEVRAVVAMAGAGGGGGRGWGRIGRDWEGQ